MKKIIVVAGIAAIFAGCAFNPESMPIGQRDTYVYVDAGAPKTLATEESKAKVAVITSMDEYKDYKQVAESLDSSLNAKLAGFSFFQVVDRTSQAALIKDAVATGANIADIDLSAEEANFLVVARITSLSMRPLTTKKKGTTYSGEVVFEFKWINKSTKRVVMTESIKPPVGIASSQAEQTTVLADAAEAAVKEFCAKIAVKYAPRARVLETRGNGAAARISLGTNYGLTEGTQVCFYEIVDNSDVGGAKRDMKDIATGKVKRVEANTAWVAVDNAKATSVRKGVYVRVLGMAKGSLLDVPELPDLNLGL